MITIILIASNELIDSTSSDNIKLSYIYEQCRKEVLIMTESSGVSIVHTVMINKVSIVWTIQTIPMAVIDFIKKKCTHLLHLNPGMLVVFL